MKFVKEINNEKITVECDNPNLYSLYEREGFKPVKKKDKTEEDK